MALIQEENLQQLLREKLKPPSYLALNHNCLVEHDVANLVRAYGRICCTLEKQLNIPKLGKVLRQDIKGGNAVYALNAQLKTHKPAGSVALRVLHSASGHMFYPLSKMIGSLISERLVELDHICTSTSNFLYKVKSSSAFVGDKIMRLDVSESYMQGTHADLVKHSFCSGAFGRHPVRSVH